MTEKCFYCRGTGLHWLTGERCRSCDGTGQTDDPENKEMRKLVGRIEDRVSDD